MAMIAIMLARYWKPLALGALLATALGYRTLLLHQRDAARRAAAAAAVAAAQLRADNESMAREIQARDAAVEAMRAAAQRRAQTMQARAQQSTRAARRESAAAGAQARALAQSPIAGGCEAAMRWGRERARELGRW